ncbi:bifunctional DNA primase/polymerase [Georgenia thermotolerans]|uniref:DNA replication protein n=1 Tax=Georgenia thermotolerans TaxID=527326 RepID=A0A7J5UTA1_9MICO|nr:bifunctional DNA primase/polymerase [Georgenia thermotolerans]KAE8765393.1 DNA replication protein [Georgenia thermotolerans]
MDSQIAPAHWAPEAMVVAARAPSPASAALDLARAGVPVFPCVSGAKQPLTRRGFLDASPDAGQVAVWWRRWPDANLGLPTGTVSGVDVVDVDAKASGSGFRAFRRALSAQLATGWAWMVRTPSGGLHAYYPHPGGTEQRSWASPGTHVDFRGDGGYVIAPPSRVFVDGTARLYVLAAVAQQAPRPVDAGALRSFLEPPRPPSPARSAPVGTRPPERLASWLAAQPEGGRNDALFWAACRMVEEGHDHASTSGLLGPAALQAGLGEREIAATIKSAFKHTSPLITQPTGGEGRRPFPPETVTL